MASLQHINEVTLEDIITCPICTLRLQEPKHLQCQHAFCAKCLKEWMLSPSNSHSLGLPCPTCRHITRLPRDGVKGLPADFNKNVLLEMVSLSETNSMLDDVCSTCQLSGKVEPSVSFCTDCEEYLCGKCLGDHNSEPALRSHNVVYGQEDVPVFNYICAVHKRKKLSFYCPKCLVLVCNVCIRTSHRGHGAQYIDVAVKEKKNALQDVLLMIDEKLEECGGSQNVEEDRRKVRQMFHEIKLEIKEHAERAKESVDEWLGIALRNLKTRHQAIDVKVATRENYLSMLSSLRLFYEEKLEDIDPRSLLMDFDEIISKGRPLLEHSAESFSIPSWSFVPLCWPDRLGYLEADDKHKSPLSTLVRRDLSNAEYNDSKSSVTSQSSSEREENDNDSLQCTVMNGATLENDTPEGDALEAGVNNGKVSNVYGAMVVKEKVSLKPLITWDSDCHIDHPDDLIIGADNWLLVGQREGRVVQRFWLDDSEKSPEVILEGFQPGRMAISRDGSIAVTDPKHGIVHMLAAKGTAISARPKWTPTQMVQPWAVAFSEDTQNVLLTDMHTKAIVVYDENLRHQRTFGGEYFESPAYMCCDRFGRILVSDGKKNLIQAFSPKGEALWRIEHWGDAGISLSRIRGITTDAEGRLLVASGNGILMYGANGRFICQFLDRHNEPSDGKGISWIQTSSDNVLIALSQWKNDQGGSIDIYKF